MSELFESLIWVVMLAVWALTNWLARRARRVEAGQPESAGEAAPESGGRRMEGLRDFLEQLRESIDPAPEEAGAPLEGAASAEGEPAAGAFPDEVWMPELEEESRPAPLPPVTPAVGRGRLVSETLRDLRGGRRSLRRAILLGEILGAPVALRRDVGAGGAS